MHETIEVEIVISKVGIEHASYPRMVAVVFVVLYVCWLPTLINAGVRVG